MNETKRKVPVGETWVESVIYPDDRSLGYTAWIVLSNASVADSIVVPETEPGVHVARCHPAIIGTEYHARTLGPSVIGNPICGVRWVEKHKEIHPSQVANPSQFFLTAS